MRRTAAIAAILGAWVTLILVTHRGPNSPYTYAAEAGGGNAVRRTVNPDATTVIGVTRFFYDGTYPQFTGAHNLRLPLHSFFTSIVAAFVRPYMAANLITNWLFAILLTIAAARAGTMYGVRPAVIVLALATVYALPSFVGYIGQPMQYIAGPVINCLIILAAIVMTEDDLRNPAIAGLMTAIMTLNYDWYVFGAALAAYLFFVIRFRTIRDALLYVAIALTPIAIWQRGIDALSDGEASYWLRSKFFGSTIAGWAGTIRHVFDRPLQPFSVTHIGAHIGTHEILAMIWWPLLLVCAIALWIGRPNLTRAAKLTLLLVLFFALEQLFTAAFDIENNPRRALPVVCAFAFAWLWSVNEFFDRKWWRVTFVALFTFTALLAFADTLTKSSALVSLYMGEAVRAEPKWVLEFQEKKLAISDSPAPEQEAARSSWPRASFETMSWPFAISQLFVGAFAFAFFWILARAKLLPRFVPLAFAAVWIVSGARYLW